jgi:hypothetical protein
MLALVNTNGGPEQDGLVRANRELAELVYGEGLAGRAGDLLWTRS